MQHKGFKEFDRDFDLIKKGTAEIIEEAELKAKLKTGKRLKVKVGFDPTAPDLHLGHAVLLTKMRQLQDLGHEVHFLIGDFTGLIGDPSGKNVTRPALSAEQISLNAKTYEQQVYKILNPELTVIGFNSKWLSALGAEGLLRLASSYTVARILERDDFAKRFGNNKPISLHELLYPLLQGFDSVCMRSDLELGGTDQKFNLLVGRELQKQRNLTPQTVITLPLLEGTDGVQKMSKSLNNYIGIDEPSDTMFGKLMSISDSLMWKYFDLLSFKAPEEILSLKSQVEQGRNPKEVKTELALEIVTRFWGKKDAFAALLDFEQKFKYKQLPDNLELMVITNPPTTSLIHLLKQYNLVKSTSEAIRLLQGGGIKLDGQKLQENKILALNQVYVLQLGKHKFFKLKLQHG